MKKIIEKIERFLCGIPSDKWVHIVVSLVLTFLIGQGIYLFSGYDLPSCGAMGAVATFVLGGVKEALDEFTGGEISYKDIAADFLGCLMGIATVAF